MSHASSNLRGLLAGLEPSAIQALRHLLSCGECASTVRELLGDEVGSATVRLSGRDVAQLERAQAELDGVKQKLERLAKALKGQKSVTSYLVVGRLECLLQDHVSPAIKDLRSIEETALGNYEALGEEAR